MEDLLPADLIADPYTRQVVSAIVLLIGLAVLWFIWKFFYTVFKHVLVGLFMLILGSGAYWYFRSSDPPRAPEVGKHAYGASSRRYLGKVASVVNDQSKGVVFGVRAPGGQIASYPKGTIILKDEMIDEPTPTPFPTATPGQLVKPARSDGGKKGGR
jgi:hypothetical protein